MTEEKVMVKKRMSKTAIVIVSVVVAVALICSTLLWYFLPKYYSSNDAYNDGRWFNENNLVLDWSVGRVREGMSYEQVIRRIGRPNRQVGSGNFIMEYTCLSGKLFRVYLICDLDSETQAYGPWRVDSVTLISMNN